MKSNIGRGEDVRIDTEGLLKDVAAVFTNFCPRALGEPSQAVLVPGGGNPRPPTRVYRVSSAIFFSIFFSSDSAYPKTRPSFVVVLFNLFALIFL